MTPREESVVRTLANRVRVMTDEQIAASWWSGNSVGLCRARKVLRRLAERNWITIQPVLARPIAPLSRPLWSWRPGDSEPDLEQLASRLHRRAGQNAVISQVIVANERAVAFFGEGRRPTVKLTQMTHDLQVSQLYLHFRKLGYSERWLSEDQLPSSWPARVRPDAVFLDEGGELESAIEYGGDYGVARLSELHDCFAEIGRGLRYEIW